jgi:hypothetical protein
VSGGWCGGGRGSRGAFYSGWGGVMGGVVHWGGPGQGRWTSEEEAERVGGSEMGAGPKWSKFHLEINQRL